MFKWHWEALQTITIFQISHSSPFKNTEWIRKTLLAMKENLKIETNYFEYFFLENNFLGISINFQDYFFLHSAFDWNPFDQSTRDICVLSVSYMFHLNKQHASAKIINTKYKMSYYNFI